MFAPSFVLVLGSEMGIGRRASAAAHFGCGPVAPPRLPNPAQNRIEPVPFGIPKQTSFTPPKSELMVVDAPESKTHTTFSFLQPWHGKDRLGSPSSTSSTKNGASTSGLEDGDSVEPGSGSGLESVAFARKQKH